MPNCGTCLYKCNQQKLFCNRPMPGRPFDHFKERFCKDCGKRLTTGYYYLGNDVVQCVECREGVQLAIN